MIADSPAPLAERLEALKGMVMSTFELLADTVETIHRMVAQQGTASADRALTIDEVAERLQIAPGTMKRWLRREPYNRAVVVRTRTCVRVSSALLEQVLLGGSGIGPRPIGGLRKEYPR